MKYFVFALACFVAFTAAAEVNPGLRITVSNGALDYLRQIFLPVLIEEVKTVKIPDMEDEVHTPVGKTKIYLTNIHMTDFAVETSSVVFAPPNLGTVSLGGISLALNFDWRYKAKIAKDHGSGEAHTSGASTKISVAISMNTTSGAPVITLSDTGFDCGDLKIKLHGGASWLYNFIISCFKGKIRKMVNAEVRQKMSDSIKQMVTGALATIPLTVDFGNGMSLCYALADQPSVLSENGGRMVAGSVAESYVTKEGRGHSPFTPSSMPKTTATSAPGPMLELIVNEFAFNTLSYAFIHSGNTHMVLDEKNAPVEAKPLLVSGFYASAIPGLIKKYGTDAKLRFELDVNDVPSIFFRPEGFLLQASAPLTMEVDDNSTYTKVIMMDLGMTVSGIINLVNSTITAHLDGINVTAKVTSSTVGDVDMKGMQQLIDFIFKYAVEIFNEVLAKGAPLPVVKGLTFVDPKIIWGSNYVVIASSFSYSP